MLNLKSVLDLNVVFTLYRPPIVKSLQLHDTHSFRLSEIVYVCTLSIKAYTKEVYCMHTVHVQVTVSQWSVFYSLLEVQ